MRTIKYTSAFKKDYKREKKGQHRNTVDAEQKTEEGELLILKLVRLGSHSELAI